MPNNFNILPYLPVIAILVLTLFVIAISLWRAAHENQKAWFISIFITIIVFMISPLISLIINVAYLFFFSKKKLTFGEIKSWFKK